VIHALVIYAQGLPDPAKSLWYIGVVAAALVFILARNREGFGKTLLMAVGAGILVFSTPGLGRAVTQLGNALFS
jgi:hypothetical protein